MNQPFDFAVVDKILSAHESQEQAIIAILQEIQEHYHYLPREVFPYLAGKLQMSEARIYSVATFYENFSLEPKGKYVIRSATAPPAMSAAPSPFWKGSEANCSLPTKRRPPTTCSLR